MMRKPWRLRFMIPALFSFPGPILADGISRDTSFENAPWVSSRAAGLGQALSTTATGLDAFYYNPALIGGVQDKIEKPLLTHLFMPYVGTSVTEGGNALLSERFKGASIWSDDVAEKLQSAWDNDPIYARASFTPTVIFKRLMFGYTYNTRTAAHRNDEDPANPLLQISEKTTSGALLGFSATAPKEEFYLGVSAAFLKSIESEAALTQTDFTQKDLRSAQLKAGKESYGAMPIHIGSAYRFKHVIKPSLSLVIHDTGSTRYSPTDKTKATRIQKEDITLGFSVSPPIASIGTLHLTTEVTRLSHSAVAFADKIRVSTEFTMGERYAADAGLSLRAAYTAAGMNYGAGMNLGILHAEIASFAEDIGIEMRKVLERKSVLNVGINIADF